MFRKGIGEDEDLKTFLFLDYQRTMTSLPKNGNEMASAHMVDTADAAQYERKIGEGQHSLKEKKHSLSLSQMLRSIKKLEDRQVIIMDQIMQMQETLNKNQKILQKVFLVHYSSTFFCITKIK